MFKHHTAAPTSRRATLLVSLAFLLNSLIPVSLADDIPLPEIGAPSGNILTPAEERRLGQAFMRSIRNSTYVVSDPLMTAYIQSLGDRLAENSETVGYNFQFFIINDPIVNAFAGPGGHIGVYTGLITTTQSENELASVLAHEMAHITQQHLVRRFDATKRMTLPAAGLTIAALVIGAASKNPDAAVMAAKGIQASMLQHQINFTRSNEEEADHIGIKTLAAAGFNSRAMPTFFWRMGQASRLYDSGKLPEFLRAHPVTSNRIADAHGRADAYPYRQRAGSLEYHLLRAQLRAAEFEQPKEAIRFYRKSLEEGRFRNEDGQRYGYVLALISGREFAAAREQIKRLRDKRPEQIDYIVALSLIEKGSNHPEARLQTLREGLEIHPGSYMLSIYYARALLEQGKSQKARTLLEQQLVGRSDNATLYKLLAQAAGDSGDKTSGHHYLAEFHYLSGAHKSAIQQLEIALRDRSMDYYTSARLTARLKQIRQEQADLKEHQR